MAINEKDQQQLSELFHRTTKGGAEATTATRLFNEKASSLGLDSFKLYSSFVQGGSLAVYQPPQPPAVPQAPQTQTSTGGPSVQLWPDTIRVRLHCAKSEQSSLATFKRDGESFALKSLTKEEANTNGKGGPATVGANFPASLLDWGDASCPHCGGPLSSLRHGCGGPFHCDCGKLRCLGGIYSKWFKLYFRCVCGREGLVSVNEGLKVNLEAAPRPSAAATAAHNKVSASTPALTSSYDPLALPAPGRRG